MLQATKRNGGVGADVHPATVNGLPGFARFHDDCAQAVIAFGVTGDRIAAVFVISNPDKLRHIRRQT